MKAILDSRQILAFSALARRGSLTLAAKDLFLTQSAVSHAIKALEEEVGCRLVDRAGKRVLLTQAGEQFLRHTDKIMSEMEAARAELENGSLVSLPLGPRKLRRNWSVAHLKGRRLALGDETFVGLCRSVAETLMIQPEAVSA
ncbi:MAG: LysR family transcriptional regulator [Pseudomonadota bacterium]